MKTLTQGDSVMMATKDGKWRPAKVPSVSQSGPRSYDIVTPQGQHYCRNRKHLRKMTGGTGDNKSVEDFLDDESYDDDSNEPIRDNSDNRESAPLVTPVPTIRCSQRTIRVPVRYADEYS